MCTEKILHRFDMHNSKLVSSPINPDVKFTACKNPDDVCSQEMYQVVFGSLLYLSNKTRPDIAFAVTSAACFCASLTKEHWTAVKRILHYLNGSQQLGLLYKANTLSEEITGFSDADWPGDVETESQHQVMYSFQEVLLLAGRVPDYCGSVHC